MKCWKTICTILAAALTLAAAVFAIVKFWDEIMELLESVKRKACCLCEDDRSSCEE